MKIIAVNGRRSSDDLLRKAIQEAKDKGPAVQLIIENSGFFKAVTVDYHGGEKYPHLVRDGSGPAFLDDILKPMAKHETRASLE